MYGVGRGAGRSGRRRGRGRGRWHGQVRRMRTRVCDKIVKFVVLACTWMSVSIVIIECSLITYTRTNHSPCLCILSLLPLSPSPSLSFSPSSLVRDVADIHGVIVECALTHAVDHTYPLWLESGSFEGT